MSLIIGMAYGIVLSAAFIHRKHPSGDVQLIGAVMLASLVPASYTVQAYIGG